MLKPKIMMEIERKKKVGGIIRDCLRPHGLESEVDVNELHVHDQYIVGTLGNNQRLSRAVLNAMFPQKATPCTLYHYTGLDTFKSIVSSGELRLYPIRKRLGQGGELEAFAEAHGLEGYLKTAHGEPFFKELSDDLFYCSMTRIPPKDPQLMWGAFAHGTGVRLEFQVKPKVADLRPIRYEDTGSSTLLTEINKALALQKEPSFIPWTLSQIGAFYLSSTVNTEDEVRLLVKRYRGGFDPTRSDGTYMYWPVPIAVENDVCRIDLIGIHVAPHGAKADIDAAIAGTAFASIPVTGP